MLFRIHWTLYYLMPYYTAFSRYVIYIPGFLWKENKWRTRRWRNDAASVRGRLSGHCPWVWEEKLIQINKQYASLLLINIQQSQLHLRTWCNWTMTHNIVYIVPRLVYNFFFNVEFVQYLLQMDEMKAQRDYYLVCTTCLSVTMTKISSFLSRPF